MTKQHGTLLVSPHSDDICMSCTHLIEIGYLPEPLHLVTVFSQSYHLDETAKSKFPRLKVPEVRLNEDLRFCQWFSINYTPLGYQDALPESAEKYTKILDSIKEDLLNLLMEQGNFNIICPHPDGNNVHIHHRIVFQAVAAAAKIKGIEVLLVDDQPYSRLPIKSSINCNGIKYIPEVVEMSHLDLDRKINVMKIYHSQMRKSYIVAVTKPAPGDYERRYSETLWLPQK